MPDTWWSTSLLIALVLLAVGLVIVGALGASLITRLQRTRHQTEGRLAELARRLRLIESRVERCESRAGSWARESEREKSANRMLPKGWCKEALDSSSPSSRDKGEPRTSPTLIAIPDLAVPEEVREHQAQSDLGQRHGEVWVLAASGASPEEIARQTRQPIGQVELILGLYRQVHSSRGPADHAPSH
jgi:type II secretory pathway pseudopilin PulG